MNNSSGVGVLDKTISVLSALESGPASLAQLVKATLLKSEGTPKQGAAWWPEQLVENRVEGISVNTQVERKVDSVLASLIAATARS